ncbi:hypothetical protein [Kordia sp.]|uniref:hypothetical protein n=1 Tax=Kordia sp. TaxID=1965332 RepID=UPI0025C5FFC3|nr:hypothetical protein [Kordia sp.]MCH2196170.1 hypothetical protein [Kordia sp.]
MKKTFLITSAFLAFFCLSCNDEILDPSIVIEQPANNGGNNGGGNNGGGNNGGNNGGGNNGTALSTYSLDTTSNVPIFGEIIVNTDFIVNSGIVVSANIQATVLGATNNSVSTITRDGNGRVIQTESMDGGNVTNRTTVTYTGDNITQIVYDDLGDNTENYTYTFAYSGTIVTRTDAANNQSAVFTFDSNSQLISKESFTGTTSTQIEVLTYSNGNCTSSTVSGANTGNNVFVYDSFTNPLKSVFNDQFLLTMFDSENDSEVGSVLATFYASNNWRRIETNDGNVDFNVTYNANNDITSRDGNFNLGDGVVITQSEAFQYQ